MSLHKPPTFNVKTKELLPGKPVPEESEVSQSLIKKYREDFSWLEDDVLISKWGRS